MKQPIHESHPEIREKLEADVEVSPGIIPRD